MGHDITTKYLFSIQTFIIQELDIFNVDSGTENMSEWAKIFALGISRKL